jgi:hypothetical protein
MDGLLPDYSCKHTLILVLSWDGLGLVCNLTTALDLEGGVGMGSAIRSLFPRLRGIFFSGSDPPAAQLLHPGHWHVRS